MIQYLIALLLVTLAEGVKAVVSGKGPKGRKDAYRAHDTHRKT
jgi:hypothetical protein